MILDFNFDRFGARYIFGFPAGLKFRSVGVSDLPPWGRFHRGADTRDTRDTPFHTSPVNRHFNLPRGYGRVSRVSRVSR
jgi:hypothetical protein